MVIWHVADLSFASIAMTFVQKQFVIVVYCSRAVAAFLCVFAVILQ